MKSLLAVALVVAACGRSDRAHDCDQLRGVLPLESNMPRRYWDYEPGHDRAHDEAKLRTMSWRDAEVRAAVDQMTMTTIPATGWTLYTPYSTTNAPDEHGDIVLTRTPSPIDKLRALCSD